MKKLFTDSIRSPLTQIYNKQLSYITPESNAVACKIMNNALQKCDASTITKSVSDMK